jgi:hypothetical protein
MTQTHRLCDICAAPATHAIGKLIDILPALKDGDSYGAA